MASSLDVSSVAQCSSVRDGVGFPSLGITERLIPAHLTMLDEKGCYSSHRSLGGEEYYTLIFTEDVILEAW